MIIFSTFHFIFFPPTFYLGGTEKKRNDRNCRIKDRQINLLIKVYKCYPCGLLAASSDTLVQLLVLWIPKNKKIN